MHTSIITFTLLILPDIYTDALQLKHNIKHRDLAAKMRKLERGSGFHKSLDCIVATGDLEDDTHDDATPFDFAFGALSSDDGFLCDFESLTCNLSEMRDVAQVVCDKKGGRIITEDMTLCDEDFEEDIGGDLVIKNVPICLATSCSHSTSFEDIFSATLQLNTIFSAFDEGKKELDSANLPTFFTGQCNGEGDMTGGVSESLLCLIKSGGLGSEEGEDSPFGFSLPYINEGVCEEETLTCDLSVMLGTLQTKCAATEGKLIVSEMTLCKEDLGDQSIGDITVKNFPICISNSCPDDISMEDLFSVTLDFAKVSGTVFGKDLEEMEVPISYTGQCSGVTAFQVGSLVLSLTAVISTIFII